MLHSLVTSTTITELNLDMEEEEVLLDTPKKSSLQQQSRDLRGALKEFERKFAAENGRKAKQADIKLDFEVAAKYKEYHRIQDVLAGRLPVQQLNSTYSTNKLRTKKHTRTDSGVGSSPHKQSHVVYATPRKHQRSQRVDSPIQELKPLDFCLVNTIGPTPHRDGKILGLFDLMTNAGSTEGAGATPSTSTRKRKIEELYESTPAKRLPLQAIQTPSQRSPSKKNKGDLLEFLTGTPQKRLVAPNTRLSRTPQSEGRKFELSQFFATPSAQRFLFPSLGSVEKGNTVPMVEDIDRTPQQRIDARGLDTTPAYLRRSTSFKDRLLSASQAPNTCDSIPCVKRAGPPTLQHFRSSTSNILRATEVQQPKQVHDTEDYDDDLDALREFEDDLPGPKILVQDSQLRTAPTGESDEEEEQPTRQYKKKGQKRTTRKANIKPVAPKSIRQPKFVAPDGFDSDNEAERVEREAKAANDHEYESGSDHEDIDREDKSEKNGGNNKVAGLPSEKGSNSKVKKKTGTINPNAQSHTNYRSLKIKNKGSKATGAGRHRFGRGRR